MEPSMSSLAYKGTIPEAIVESRRQKKLFVVYISGLDDDSNRLESDTWTDSMVAETLSKFCVFLHIRDGSTDAANFSAIYPQKSVPSVTAVGYNGVQLWESEGFIEAEDLASNLEKAWLSLHIQETTAAVLTGALYSNSSSQNSGPPEGGSSSDAVISSSLTDSSSDAVSSPSSTDILRTSAQAGQQIQSEKIIEKNGSDNVPQEEEMKIANPDQVQSVEDEQCSHCEDIRPTQDEGPKDNTVVSGSELESVSVYNKFVDDKNSDKLDGNSVEMLKAEDHSGVKVETEVIEVVQAEKAKHENDQKGGNTNNEKLVEVPTDVALSIRLPSGVTLRDKFLLTTTLGMVKDYVDSKGSTIGSYDLAIPYPRKVFHGQDLSRSLAELNMLNRQALLVVPRDKATNFYRDAYSERAIATNDDSSDANSGGYFAYVKRIISFINPLSYLGINASSSGSGHGESGSWEYSPDPALQNNIGGDRAPSSYPPSQSTSAGSRIDGQRRITPSPSGSNVHFLKHDEDDSQFSDRNSFWNGNSTQYGGDGDAK